MIKRGCIHETFFFHSARGRRGVPRPRRVVLPVDADRHAGPDPGEESLADLIAAGRVSEVRSRFANSSALNQKDAAGQSLLHVAALKNDAEMVRLLIELKADPDIRDNVGDTPLSASIQAGCLDAARALAEGNASVFSANAAGRPVHALAREKGATVSPPSFPRGRSPSATRRDEPSSITPRSPSTRPR
jgi:hypothetical protein